MSRGFVSTVVLMSGGLLGPYSFAAGPDGMGWYFQGNAGYLRLAAAQGTERDPDGGGPGSQTLASFPVEYGDGTAFGISGGYAFESSRLELQVEQLDSEFMEPAAATVGSSEIRTHAALVNVWYAFGKDWWVQPYLGGGLGYARHTANGAGHAGPLAQVGVGADWSFGERWTLTVGYRFLGSESIELKLDDRDLSVPYRGQSLSLGIRYDFFGPTPAPVPEPVKVVAPAPSCSDGVDNDFDGLVDFPNDPGCESADDQDETDPPQCRDGRDNDADGRVDYPDDKDCSDDEDNDESDRSGGLVYEDASVVAPKSGLWGTKS